MSTIVYSSWKSSTSSRTSPGIRPRAIARIAAALARVPKGAQYDTPNTHFEALADLVGAQTDTSAIAAFMMRTYPADTVSVAEAGRMAAYFAASDKRVTAEEWRYAMVQSHHKPCPACLGSLIQVCDHEPRGTRLPRLLEALEHQTKHSKADACSTLRARMDS
jgi:hypothetical protein